MINLARLFTTTAALRVSDRQPVFQVKSPEDMRYIQMFLDMGSHVELGAGSYYFKMGDSWIIPKGATVKGGYK